MRSSLPADRPPSLLNFTSAPDYFARVSEVVALISTARDRTSAVELLEEATLRMGAEVAVFASFIRDADSCASYRLLLACDPQWCIEYEQLAWYADDPWLAYARHHTEPIRGSEMVIATDAQWSIVDLAKRFGFESTVIVPTPSSSGLSRLGALWLGSSVPGYFEAEGYIALKVVARSVAMELHEWWLARLRDELIERTGINEMDRAMLERERLGQNTKEIARELGSNVRAINSRYQRLCLKLGVTSRKAAVQLAAEYGLI